MSKHTMITITKHKLPNFEAVKVKLCEIAGESSAGNHALSNAIKQLMVNGTYAAEMSTEEVKGQLVSAMLSGQDSSQTFAEMLGYALISDLLPQVVDQPELMASGLAADMVRLRAEDAAREKAGPEPRTLAEMISAMADELDAADSANTLTGADNATGKVIH